MYRVAADDLKAAGIQGFDGEALSLQRAVIDSRTVRPGDLFVCLKGENTDGHLYVGDAIGRGASVLLVEQGRREEIVTRHGADVPVLASEDVLRSLQALAAIRRDRFAGTVYAVVGSNGKTSTKEILASLLRCQLGEEAVFATPGNWNNHLGVPLSLLSLPDTARAAVFEIGMNHAGEVEQLGRLVRPHHCVVPSIGWEHMEFFASVEEVAAAELEILFSMKGGVIVYPEKAVGQELLKERAEQAGVRPILFELGSEEGQTKALYQGNGFVLHGQFFSCGQYAGEAMASNILACVLLLEHSGHAHGLASCTARLRPQARGRFEVEGIAGRLLVDDTYNANPDSFRQSIRTLRQLLPQGRLLCVAGHMAELGHCSEVGHRQVGEDLAAYGFEDLLVCGHDDVKGMLAGFGKPAEAQGKYFPDSVILSKFLKEHPERVDGFDGILVKGSRSAHMERVLPVLRELLEKGKNDV